MSIIGIIIGIIIIVAIISAVLEEVGKILENIITIIVGIGLLVGAFFLIKFLLKRLNFLICLIPKWLLYGYIVIFLAFIVTWFIVCSLNENLSIVIDAELSAIPIIGTENQILTLIKNNIERHTVGITRLMTKMHINSNAAHNMIKYKCVQVSSGYCSIAIINELSSVLSDLGIATDEELMAELENRQEMISAELNRIRGMFTDIKACCQRLEEDGKIKIEDCPSFEGNDFEYIEKKLYRSTRPNPNPTNMLPTQYFEIE